ncbi:transcriptional regulator [Enterobacteriaceae bacterium C34A]
MNITELGKKSDYIASKRHQLHSQWKHYTNTLTQGVTLSKTHLHLTVGQASENALRFMLFDYYALEIRLARGFHTQTVQYTFEQEDGETVVLGEAMISGEGLLNDDIPLRDRQSVLEHYLTLITPVYDVLYRATQLNMPEPATALLAGVDKCRNASNLAMG